MFFHRLISERERIHEVKREKIFARRARSVTRRLDGLSDSASAIDFTRRAKNDRVIMQHFPTQQENMSTYAIKVLSRREIRETAQGGGATALGTHGPFRLRSFAFRLWDIHTAAGASQRRKRSVAMSKTLLKCIQIQILGYLKSQLHIGYFKIIFYCNNGDMLNKICRINIHYC